MLILTPLPSFPNLQATLRNHPSILVWTLCNEMYMGAAFKTDGITFGAERARPLVLDSHHSGRFSNCFAVFVRARSVWSAVSLRSPPPQAS